MGTQDSSCPFVDKKIACDLFEMCLSIYVENMGKTERGIIALDEAHKVRLTA